MDKRKDLLALARLRQQTRWEGYKCIGDADYHDGIYECDYVSPYTKSAGNVDADIMIMLQDWSSDEDMKKPVNWVDLGYDPTYPTNVNLINLLQSTFGTALRETYATNLFPFVKLGGMSASIPHRDLVAAAREFAIPQIQIVRPRLVICLGLATFNALRRARGLGTCPSIDLAVSVPFDVEGSRVWCQAHTGRLGQNNRNRGGIDRVSSDWARMKEDVFG